eukprot:m.286048 g.286048  ORF g.286048 m.286048 type:complete len:57 (+) comp16348_c0_seq18:781-951(+)
MLLAPSSKGCRNSSCYPVGSSQFAHLIASLRVMFALKQEVRKKLLADAKKIAEVLG